MHFGNINLKLLHKSTNLTIDYFKLNVTFNPLNHKLCDILLDLFQHQKGVE